MVSGKEIVALQDRMTESWHRRPEAQYTREKERQKGKNLAIFSGCRWQPLPQTTVKVVSPPGIEPGTHALKGRCSTN